LESVTRSCGPRSWRSRIERLRHSLQERCIVPKHGPLREDGGARAHENACALSLVGLLLSASQGQARVLLRSTITLTSDSGKSATLAVVIRHGGLRAGHFSSSQGRYRCIGDACLTRRGRLFREDNFGVIYLTPKGRPNLRCTLSPNALPGFPGSSSGVYSCWREFLRSRTLVDSGRYVLSFRPRDPCLD